MKLIILTLITLVISGSNINVSAQKYEWVRTDGNTGDINSREMSKGCARDNSGNLYVIGSFGGSNGGSTIIGNNTLTSKGKSDIMLIKYDPNGTCIWVRTGGSINYDYIYGLELDGQGNIYISGRFGVTAGGGTGMPMILGSTSLNGFGKSDCFLVKFSSNGDLIWGKSFGGTGDDQLNNMTSDGNGNMYFCGSYQETIYFPAVTLMNNTGYYRSYLAKVNSSGVFSWVKNTEGTRTILGIDVKFKKNFLVMCGRFYGTMHAGSLSVQSNGESDAYIIKYDNNGNEMFMKNYGAAAYDEGYRTDISSGGEIFLTGSFDYQLDFGNNITLNAVGGTNTFVCKMDEDGDALWATSGEVIAPPGFSGGIYPMDIIVDSRGDSYLTGYFDGGVVFQGDTLHRSPAGLCDSYLIKYSRTGEKLYIKQILSGGVDEPSYTFAQDLSTDNSDNVYISGYYSGRSTFDEHVLTANGMSHDMFIAKVSALTTIGDPTTIANLQEFSLAQNFPNPFNPETNINFTTPAGGIVTIKVFDITGKEVMTLLNEYVSEGNHFVRFDGSRMQSGTYFYTMTVEGKYSQKRRMILVK